MIYINVTFLFEMESDAGFTARDKELNAKLASMSEETSARSIWAGDWEYVCFDRLNSRRMPISIKESVSKDPYFQKYEHSDVIWPIILFRNDGAYDITHLANFSDPPLETFEDACLRYDLTLIKPVRSSGPTADRFEIKELEGLSK